MDDEDDDRFDNEPSQSAYGEFALGAIHEANSSSTDSLRKTSSNPSLSPQRLRPGLSGEDLDLSRSSRRSVESHTSNHQLIRYETHTLSLFLFEKECAILCVCISCAHTHTRNCFFFRAHLVFFWFTNP